MGKNTGFLDYKRTENGNVAPLERIKNFKEFHPKLDEDARKEQAARCMNCGVQDAYVQPFVKKHVTAVTRYAVMGQ